MDTKLVLLCLGLCFLILAVEETHSKKTDAEEADELSSDEVEDHTSSSGFTSSIKTCQGKSWERPHTFTKASKKCDGIRKKAKEDKDTSKTGAVCDAACVFKQAELFKDDNYKVDQSAVDDLVDEILSGDLASGRPALKKEWKACKAEIDEDTKDNDKCKKIKPYFKCFLGALKKHCAGGGGPSFSPPKGGLLGGLLG